MRKTYILYISNGKTKSEPEEMYGENDIEIIQAVINRMISFKTFKDEIGVNYKTRFTVACNKRKVCDFIF